MNRFKSTCRGFFVAFIVAALLPIPAMAQDDEERRFENVATQRVKAITQALAKKLQPIREENLGSEQPDFRRAIADLNRIDLDDYEGHEKAEIYNLLGYAHYSLDNVNEAIRSYQRIINEPEANAPLVTRTLKTLSQLNMGRENYPEALKFMRQWMATQEIVGAPDYAYLSAICYGMDDLECSLSSIETAIEQREARGELGQEGWYGMQRSLYFERRDYTKVIEILKLLATNFPNARYWREMGGIYAELEDREMQMRVYDVAYLQDGLTTQGQLLSLAYMYIGVDAPARAAKVIQKGMDDGIIERSEKNLELLGNTIYQSRDEKGALPVMEQAASLSENGEIYSRLSNLYLDLERYADAEKAAREAIRRGGIRRPDIALLVLGRALFNQRKYDEAIREFRKVKDSRTETSARQWIVHVERERDRRRQLAAAGIDY